MSEVNGARRSMRIGGGGGELTIDLLEQRRNVLVIKGKTAAEHDVEDDSAAPNIDFRPGVKLAADNFRGGVVWAATGCFEKVAVLHDVGEAKIANLDVKLVIEKEAKRERGINASLLVTSRRKGTRALRDALLRSE